MKTALKVILGIVAAAVVIVLVTVIVVLTSAHNEDGLRAFTFDDVFSNTFYTEQYYLGWISETEYIRKNGDGNVLIYNVETGRTNTILKNTTFEAVNATNYQLSPDKKFAYLESNYRKQWRYSYTASYHIYDVDNDAFVGTHELPPRIQYISWSTVGHKLAYVLDNNIYLKNEPEERSTQLTMDGKENEIFNGIPDWVYEEEMLGSKSAIWWSTNDNFIAYVQFNDKDVPLIEYPFYGEDQYPKTVKIPYPKAGAKNPAVKLFIVKVDDKTYPTVQIPVPSLISSSEYCFSWVTWILDKRVSVQWVTRIQNISIISICDYNENLKTWSCPKDLQHVEASKTGWIGVFFPSLPVFTSDSISYYQILSDQDGYKHIHYINDSMDNAIQITRGRWEAVGILLVTDKEIYYSSNEYEGFPGRRNVYRISLQGNVGEKKCLTCTLRKERCQYYVARFSTNTKYYSLSCYGPGLPIFTIHNGNTDEAFWYKMTLPPHFRKSKKYPLLLYVYGGPSSQEVQHTFSIGWKTYLASSEGIIVASVDGRGTAYQGDKVMHAVYKRLGTLEIEDQISAVRQFVEMGFIDEHRVAIWGWSYGGYVTSMVLGQNTGLFKCGMAVAPVSNWEYYASIYTERYMGLPTKSDNLQNYQNSTVMSRAENFRKVDYLLIHGTADDNVHFQQAAQISKALVDAQVDFEAMWYTDKDHSISGSGRRHLYKHMTRFLKKCFSLS